MNQLFHSKDRKFIVAMSALTLGALVLAIILVLAMTAYANQLVSQSFSGIIGKVVNEYPQAEAEVVQALSAPEADSIELGNQILKKYGLGNQNTAHTKLGDQLLGLMLPVVLVLVGLFSLGFILILIFYKRSVTHEIENLSDYLLKIESGDYGLDVRDNGEGSFSLLKNDVYKITVRLREQAEQLQKDKTALSNLIADISHQIKTPLTSLSVLADLLTEDPPEKDRHIFVERLRVQLGRISWLVTALLKLARMDAGTAIFKNQPVKISNLVKKALESLQIPIEIKNLKVDVRGEDHSSFMGDFNWSLEALTNVIKNSVEHSPENGLLEISYSANNLFAELVVSDNGEGIPVYDLPNIFNRFYRSSNAGENSVGIGLALAKAIIIAQGGDISAMSQTGLGTRITIRVFNRVV